ncbi:MAG: response regulator transcription factor [Candidatus Scatomorpha sp.]|jgi:DNA-binding response OmpR family regulator
MKRILIVDDDVHIGNMLEEALAREGYAVSRAYSGTEAVMSVKLCKPGLVLLDLMLPGLSGEEVLPKLRGIPVILMSAKASVDSKVELLLGGAADYVTKPFIMRELLARIVAALRSPTAAEPEELTFGALRLDTGARTVSCGENEVRLTRTEYAILKLLMSNPGQVVTRSVILERITGDTPDCTESSLKIHISHLRRKLREAGAGDCIEAVWGIGFRLREG